jgi:hypothetical protein
MLGLRIPLCLALLAAGCGSLDVATATSALNSCNSAADCPKPSGLGTCVKVVCASHACGFAMDMNACPSGCTGPTQLTDCALGLGACFVPPCSGTTCDFTAFGSTSVCECNDTKTCAAPTNPTCQNAAQCITGSCTYTAKRPLLGTSCCDVDGDCGGTAVCGSNTCGCVSGSDKFCPGDTVGTGRCVVMTGCCQPTDCATGNSCQARTCSLTGACGFASNGNAGCCNSAPDCAPRGNATVACTDNTCVYTCNSGFHDCSGICKSDTSPASCGTMCSACPTGNSCQVATCNSATCGLGAAGASPCCNVVGDCTPANACQTATACTANMCSFGSTGASGCCNSAGDCAAPTDPCLQATCVANQCATAPVSGCVDDLALPVAPDDLAMPPVAPPDLATPISLSGGGGCALGGARAPSPRAPLFMVALLLAAFALRRRRA